MPNNIQILQTSLLLAAVLTVGANAFVLSPILSEVGESLTTDPYTIAWSISTFGAATAISGLFLAGYADRRPVGQALGGATLVLALAQVMSALATHWVWLCLAQALAGVSAGIILPISYATAAGTAPTGREAARLGVVLTGWSLSLTLAVPMAAIIAERLGWRAVYWTLAIISTLIASGLVASIRSPIGEPVSRTSPWTALSVAGVPRLLIITFGYTCAFYGSFAFFGEGIKTAFALGAEGTGLFVLAYGLGFGIAGIGLGLVAPTISRGYLVAVLLAIAASYAAWRLALGSTYITFAAALVWGMLNQMGLNALVVSLSRRADDARGAVMGLNTAVTYSAVFAGPLSMTPIFAQGGFPEVTIVSAVIVAAAATIAWKIV